MAKRMAAVILCSLILWGCRGAPVTPEDADLPVELAPQATASPTQNGASSEVGAKEPDRTVDLGPRPPTRPHHVDIHGLYMTGWVAGSDRFYELVDYMLASGLNAVVIDAQDDDGIISWKTEIPLALELGASEAKIADIDARVRYLKERGIYTIARIVVYADPLLGRMRPDMAILGGEFADSRGIHWPDPYNQEVWAYKIAIARDAASRGFDEVQFDYIRFPEQRIQGYNAGVPVNRRTGAIESFLREARTALEPAGVFIAADLFGLTTSVAEGNDMEIGQDYRAIAEIVDYVLPMVYPSHYDPGTYGVDDPNAEPGRIVYESLVAAQKRTWGMDVRKHRPWIQDFNYGKRYTAADVEAQIRGLAEAGIYQWILWDPQNRYTREVNYGLAGLTGPPGEWRASYRPPAAGEPLSPRYLEQ